VFKRLREFVMKHGHDEDGQPSGAMIQFLVEEAQDMHTATTATYQRLFDKACSDPAKMMALQPLSAGMGLVAYPTMCRQLDTVCTWLGYYDHLELDIIEAEFRTALEEVREVDSHVFRTEQHHGILTESIDDMVADWRKRIEEDRRLKKENAHD